MKKISYEAAIKKLEDIVRALEEGNHPLEDALKLFEEGTKLAAFCNAYLDNAEQKITELTLADAEESSDEQ